MKEITKSAVNRAIAFLLACTSNLLTYYTCIVLLSKLVGVTATIMASTAPNSDNNPGTMMASAVDAEVAKYRETQESIQQLRSSLQHVLSQLAENEMVLSELELLEGDDEESTVYKMVGPVLIKQDLDEAVQTVKKRLEFINGEKSKIIEQIAAADKKANDLAQKVNQMNATLQQTTAQAVQAIAAEHQKQST